MGLALSPVPSWGYDRTRVLDRPPRALGRINPYGTIVLHRGLALRRVGSTIQHCTPYGTRVLRRRYNPFSQPTYSLSPLMTTILSVLVLVVEE